MHVLLNTPQRLQMTPERYMEKRWSIRELCPLLNYNDQQDHNDQKDHIGHNHGDHGDNGYQ